MHLLLIILNFGLQFFLFYQLCQKMMGYIEINSSTKIIFMPQIGAAEALCIHAIRP